MMSPFFLRIVKTGGIGLFTRLIASVSQIAFIPLLIGLYGKEGFGLIATLVSLNSFIVLSNFGISKSMLNKIARLDGNTDCIQISGVFSKSILAISKLSALTIISLFSAWIVFEALFLGRNILPSLPLYIGFMISAYLNLLLSVFLDLLRGLQKTEKANSYLLVMTVCTILLTGFSIFFGLGLLWFYVLVYVLPLLLVLSYAFLFSFERVYFNYGSNIGCKFNSVFDNTSRSFFILTLVQFLNFGSGTAFVAFILGPAGAAEYNIVFKFYSLFIFALGVFTSVIWPFFTKYQALGEIAFMRSVAIKGYMFSIVYGFFAFIAMVSIVPFIINNVLNVSVSSGLLLFVFFGVQIVFVSITSIVIPMLNAFEKLKIQATFGIASAFINVLLIIPFVKYFGIVGAPLATTIAHLFFGVIPLSIVLYRYFKHESIAH